MTMTTAEFLEADRQVPTRVERDNYGRPLIEPVPGAKRGKKRMVTGTDKAGNPAVFQTDKPAYTRASTLGKALDDEAGLTNWKQRMTALGVAKRKDLILAANAHGSDITTMSDIVEQAMAAAEAGAAATSGTALHELLDAYDQGRTPYLPDEYRGDVTAYLEATKGLEFVRSETFVVDDELEVAGTYDNLYRLKTPATTPTGEVLPVGTLIIADKKTGKEIKYGHCSWSCQLSVYAHGLRYDPATDSRLDPEPINRDWGLIVHVPVMRGTATLYWIDLRKGRELAHLATKVRAERKSKTMKPAVIELAGPDWATELAGTMTLAALREVWTRCSSAGDMTDDLRARFTTRAGELS